MPMLCTCYLKKDTVLIPTVGRVARGPSFAIEPVAVLAVSDTEALRQAFKETVARGNPDISRVHRTSPSSLREPVLHKYAGVRSGGAFQRSTLGWWLRERDGIYRIEGLIEKEGYHGGKVTDPDQIEIFPPGTSMETVIDRMVAILQSAKAR